MRSAQWRASDPNGDPLRFRVEARHDGATAWIELAKDLDEPRWTWDTSPLKDGRYRLRVVASDEAGNAVGEELTTEAVSQPFTVDNTPPVLEDLGVSLVPGSDVLEVVGGAADATSPLQRIEISLDNGPWRAVTPEGGFTDALSHRFRVRIPRPAGAATTVSVRVVDLAGNSATRAMDAEAGKRATVR
jgi:hypothetical protein